MLIQSATKKYEVSIHSSLDPVKDMAVDEKTFVVIDKQVYELYCGQLFQNIPQDRLYLLEATEVNKVLDTALDICERMTSIPAKRNAKLISLGPKAQSLRNSVRRSWAGPRPRPIPLSNGSAKEASSRMRTQS